MLNASPRQLTWLSYAAALFAGVLFWFVLIKVSWLSDDYWIPARQIEQLFAGNGLRWNPHERVQLFTPIIAFFFRVIIRVFTEDHFIIHAVQAIFFNGLMLAALWLLFKSPSKWAAAVLLLVASNSFMDHSWNGMGNNVGHALLIILLYFWQALFQPSQTAAAKRTLLIKLMVTASLLPLSRHDMILLAWFPALYALWVHRQALSWRWLVALLALLGAPLALWTLFSIFYFGFPFPLSAYFKLGGGFSRFIILINGYYYYRWTFINDLPILFIIAFAVWQLLARSTTVTIDGVLRSPSKPLAIIMLLYLFYILYSGADYMGGRFFSYPYLIAVVVLVLRWQMPVWQPTAFALVWMLALPHTPLNSPWVYHKQEPLAAGGISDERAVYHQATSLDAYLAYVRGEVDSYPSHRSVDLAKNVVGKINIPVLHICDMGMTPFFSGRLDQKMIDIYGYSDPFQARLPGLNTRPGHMFRRLPKGYLESVAVDDALLADEALNEYYTRLRRVTQEPLTLSWARLSDIWYVNFNFPHIEKGAPRTTLPLLCYLKHPHNDGVEVIQQLKSDPENFDSAILNQSSLVES